MAVTARFIKQRKVKRGVVKPRFTKQKRIWRGSTKSAAPVLTSIAPTTGVMGTANVTVTCTGSGFVSGVTRVTLNGQPQATTFVSATSVTAIMPLSTQTGASTVQVNVANNTVPSITPKPYTVTAVQGDPQQAGYDPGEHTITDVHAYVDAHADEADEILERERNGTNRVTLIDWLEGFIAHRDEP